MPVTAAESALRTAAAASWRGAARHIGAQQQPYQLAYTSSSYRRRPAHQRALSPAAMEALPDPLLGRIFAAAGREAGVSPRGAV